MLKYILALIAFLLPLSAHAEYMCIIDTGGGRSSASALSQFETLEQAENVVRGYVIEKPKLVNKSDFYPDLAGYGAFLLCYDSNGNFEYSKYFRSRPNCEISAWNGSFDCEDFVIVEEK